MKVNSQHSIPRSPGSVSNYINLLPKFNFVIWTLQSCGGRPLLSASSLFLDAAVERRFEIPGLDQSTAQSLVSELNRRAGWDDEIAAWQARRLAEITCSDSAGDTVLIADHVSSDTSGGCHEQ
jgi:hypothetical protein